MLRRTAVLTSVLLALLALPVVPALAQIPNKPDGVGASVASRQLTVHWNVVRDDGSRSPIDNYMVTLFTPSNQVTSRRSASSPITFYGLPHGVYKYYVAAHNADGWGHISALTAIEVPDVPGPPPAPTTQLPSPGTYDVAWSPPADDGGSRITLWHVLVDGTVHAASSAARSARFTAGPGTTHEIRVAARNQWGYGPYGDPVRVTVRGAPGKVQNVVTSATPDGTVHVSWDPPGNTGGRTIGAYLVQFAVKGTAGPTTISKNTSVSYPDVAPDSPYTVSVVAVGRDSTDAFGDLDGPVAIVAGRTPAAGRATSAAPSLPSSPPTAVPPTPATPGGSPGASPSGPGPGGSVGVPTGTAPAARSGGAAAGEVSGGVFGGAAAGAAETSGTGWPWWWYPIGGAALLVAAALLFVALRRRRPV